MRISTEPQNTPLSFKALKVANIKKSIGGTTSSIDLYQLRREDYGFLQKLAKKIDFKGINTKLNEFYHNRWEKVFKYCLETAFDHYNITYVAISDNKPCGIMTFNNLRSVFLDGICAIPNEEGKKTPFAGSSLLYELFQIAKNTGSKNITLKAVPDGTFNPVKKYEELGFKRNAVQTTDYIDMECNKYAIDEQLKRFAKEMEYTPYNCERVRLDEFID